jgi:parallel beta-helix repeat protein
MRSTFCSVVLIVMMLSISFVLVPAIPASATDPSGSISIVGDSELRVNASKNSWPGDGSTAHPFIIEDLTIDGGSETGIMIRDTSLYLVIRDCTFTDSVRCIDIAGSRNILIENNSFHGNLYGCNIYLQGSSNIVVHNNVMDGNDNGLYISDSSNNAILDNTISNARWDGIDMETNSDNNAISHNTIIGAIDSGVYLSMSDGNTVSHNTVSGAHYGIYLESSSGDLVSDNTVGDSEYEEICLSSAIDNTISHNTILGGGNGIYGQSSDGNVISNNIVNGALSDDILFEDSNGLTISNNTITGADNGIHLSETDRTLVSNNTVIDANVNSIFLDQSVDDTISGNTLTDSVCYQGIYLLDSSKCIISENTVVSTISNIYGIILSGINLDSSSAHLDGNHLTDCLIMPSIEDSGNDRDCINDTTISPSDTVNGQPVYFFKNSNMNNALLPSDTGEVLLFNVTNADIKGLDLKSGLVFVGYSSNLTIEDSSIANAAVGVYLFESDHCSVVDNDITDPQSCGIILESSQYNTISGNTVTSAEPIAMGCIFMMVSDHNTISGNTLTGGDLMLEESSANTVEHNVMTGADEGIYMLESEDNTVLSNIITDSASYGVLLTDCAGNTLYSNVLVGNDGSTSTYNAANVQAYDDGHNVWNTAALGNFWGDWQGPDVLNPRGIVDRPYAIDGGAGAQDHLPMVMDASPMTLSISTPTEGSWNNNDSVIMRWTANDALYGIAKVEISTDGSSWTDVTGTNSYLFTLDDGPHTFHVRATNNEGQVKNASTTFHLDTLGPSVSIVQPHDLSYSKSGIVNVSWIASDSGSGLAKTEVQVDTGPWSTVSGTAIRLTGINDGCHTVTVRATDKTGNVNTASVRFTIDTVKPALSIVTPAAGSWSNSTALYVNWTASDSGSGLTYFWFSLDNGTWTNTTQESIAVNGLSDGLHTLELRAYDGVGNYNTIVRTFQVDTMRPTLCIATPTRDALLNISAVTVSWSANDMSGIAGYEVSMDGGVWTDLGMETSHSFASLADGSHTFALKCEDIAGNCNETSVSFIIDTSAPEVIKHSPVGGEVPVDTTITVSFSERMNMSTVNVLVNGVRGTLSWTGNDAILTPASALASNATYAVDAIGKDIAGNSVELTWSFMTLKIKEPIKEVADNGTSGAADEGMRAVVRGEIQGVIEDLHGNPIASATVTLSNGMTTFTDSMGHFVFENVTAGTYQLNATKAGFVPIVQYVSASAGQTNELGTLSASMVQASNTASNDDNSMLGVGALVVAVGLLSMLLLAKRRRKQ